MTSFPIDLEGLSGFCARQGLEHQIAESGDVIAISCALLEQPVSLFLMLGSHLLTLAMRLPFTVPACRHETMMLALAALNGRIQMGSWSLNTESGALYFRIAMPTRDVAYTDESLRFVARLVTSTAEQLAGRLAEIARGEVDARAVVVDAKADAMEFWA